MCLKIENFEKRIHSQMLPSPLWGIHVDPQHEFIAIVHIKVQYQKVVVDKWLVLSTENNSFKTVLSLNNEIVHIPNLSKIETVNDLYSLINILHNTKVCKKCSKFMFESELNICDCCSAKEFSDTRSKLRVEKKITEIISSEPDTYLDNVASNSNQLLDSSDQKQDIFVCAYCEQNFKSQELLDKHSTTHAKQKRYLCNVCGRTFSCPSGIEHHMLTHIDNKPFKCKVCIKSFTKKYNLNVHMRVHSGERPYVCSKCGKTFSTRSNLSTHLNSTHRDEKKHACEFCEMTFVHPRVLRIHMRKHTGEKPFMCQLCGKLFAKNIHLTVHTRTHTGEKPYICSVCGKGFTTTGNLNSHKKINHKVGETIT